MLTLAAAVGATLLVLVSAGTVGWRAADSLVEARDGADRALHALVAGVVGLTGVSLVAQALGSVGLFARWPLTVAMVALAILSTRLPRALPDSRTDAGSASASPPPLPPATRSFALVAAGGTGLLWLGPTTRAAWRGVTEFDSLHYHLPHAAHMARTARVFDVNVIDPGLPLQFHPGGLELVHAIGMILTGNDRLSAWVNIGFLLLAALAVTVMADLWRRPRPMAVGILAAVLSTPLVVRLQPGTAHSDMAVIALLLASGALFRAVRDEPRPAPFAWVLGMALGLAAGAKFTAVVPVAVALLVVGWVAGPGRRATTLAATGIATTVVGGGWYLRNTLAVGNPVPTVDIGVLPVVRLPELDHVGFSVAHYLGDIDVWREIFLPGLARAFGPTWPMLVMAMLVGVVAGWRAGAERAAIAWVAVVGGLAYVVTPWTALGPDGAPLTVTFVANLRYALAPVTIGILLTLLVRTADDRVPAVLTGGAAAVVVTHVVVSWDLVELLVETPGAWPMVVVLALGIGLAVAAPRRHLTGTATIAIAGLTVLLALPVARADRAYASPTAEVWAWARDLPAGARVGHAGFPAVYVLYGPSWDVEVEALTAAGGPTPRPVTSCREAVAAAAGVDHLVLGRWERFVLVSPDGPVPPPDRRMRAWLKDTPGFRTVLDGPVTVLTRDGPIDPDAVC